jgi:PKD repeat protein
MRIFYLFILALSTIAAAAQGTGKKSPARVLTEREIVEQARSMGIPEADIKGYVAYRKSLLLAKEKSIQIKPQQADTSASMCFNMGFETSGFSGWVGRTGSNVDGTAYFSERNLSGSRHIIVSPGHDPLVGTILPTVSPWGGSRSVRLGNGVAGAESEQLERTFLVTEQNRFITYSYAVVTELSEHPDHIHPFFIAEIIDINGKQLSCSADTVRPNSAGIMKAGTGSVVYKNWTSRTVDLSDHLGKYVKLRFTTADCSLGGHFSYAYVDASCVSYSVDKSLCGVPVSLSAPQGAASYEWSTGEKASSIQANDPGNYYVTVTNTNGCAATVKYTVKQGYVPPASYTTSIAGAAVTFTSSAQNSKSTYLWDFGDGTPLANAPNPVHTYTSAGTYIACLTVNDNTGCNSTICQPLTIAVPNNNTAAKKEPMQFNDLISIYPNPSSTGFITADLSTFDLKKVKISVFDILGNSVYEREIISNNNIEKYVVDISAQPAGNYYMTVESDSGVTTRRICLTK